MVPQRRHGARQRAGRRGPLRAVRNRWSSRAVSSSGSSRSPTTPTGCWRTSTCSSRGPRTWSPCSATGSAGPRAPRSVFRCEELELDFTVFTTRPDTLFGATFFVLAPEHPEVEQLIAGSPEADEGREYVAGAMRASAEDRGAEEREKTGVRLGRTVTNPVNGEQIPMFVADYVLMEYGTGRDHGGAGSRRARLRVRAEVRARDPAGGRPRRRLPGSRGRCLRRSGSRRCAGQLRPVRRPDAGRGEGPDHRLARRA